MAAIKEIQEIEQARETAEEWWKIHLFQEGSFYRAYEVSAWLCHTYVSQFKVTHTLFKAMRLLTLTTNYTNNYQRRIMINLESHEVAPLPVAINNSCNSCNLWSLQLFLVYLTREITLFDPTDSCRIKGNRADWQTLPKDKSLFHSPKGCGLPIGNLTSQLFSNVYLGRLDDYMKRTLRCHRYGRYVDDFYIVSTDREWLRSIIPQVRQFLRNELGLMLHEGKTRICSVRQGVEFLGAYLKPHRRYVSGTTLRRMMRKLPSLAIETDPVRLCSRQASFCSVLSHYRAHWLVKRQTCRQLWGECACFQLPAPILRSVGT